MKSKLVLTLLICTPLLGCTGVEEDSYTEQNIEDTQNKIEVENPDELLSTYVKLGSHLYETLNLDEIIQQDSLHVTITEIDNGKVTRELTELLPLLDRHPVLIPLKEGIQPLHEQIKYLQSTLDIGKENKEYIEYMKEIQNYTKQYTLMMGDVVEDYYTQKGLDLEYTEFKKYRTIVTYEQELEILNYLDYIINNQSSLNEVEKTTGDLKEYLDKELTYPTTIKWVDTLIKEINKEGLTYIETVNLAVSIKGNQLKNEERVYLNTDKMQLQKLENFKSYFQKNIGTKEEK